MLILKNCKTLNFSPAEVSENRDIIISGDKIIDAGAGIAGNYEAEKTIDLNGKFVSTGIVCAHNHFYSALSRGIMANIKPSPDFISILKNLWWKLDRALDEETLYYSGITAALDAIKCGTTSVIDHNASPSFIRGSLNLLKKCFNEAGLRGILAYEITDRNGIKGMMEGVRESVDFINSVDDEKNSGAAYTVEAAVGGHAPFTLNDNSLSLIADAMAKAGRGLHIHVSEDQYDATFAHHHSGKDVMERLENFNLLNDKSIIVHGVYLSENDINIINAHDSFLIHNPRSNMNNSVGYNNKLPLVKNKGLGTDGIGSDMLEEVKFAFFKNGDSKGKLSYPDFLKILQNGNVLLERYFGSKFGKIEKGYIADLVIYDYAPPTPVKNENLAGHLLFGLSSKDVESVIINGKVVYENRRFPFETEVIYEKARAAAEKLWTKMDSLK
jgi:putative selenium metabolism protein SsnA